MPSLPVPALAGGSVISMEIGPVQVLAISVEALSSTGRDGTVAL